MIESMVFYLFAAIIVGCATMMITVRNTVQAAFYLVLAFFASSAIWLLLEAEFLALALVLVYVGAVMVLFIFVIMMLDINQTVMRKGFVQYLPIGLGVGAAMLGSMFYVINNENFGLAKYATPERQGADYSNTRELGILLYTEYAYAFEIAAVILLVAIVAAITLTLRRRPNTKHQKAEDQSATMRDDRVRLVSMKAEKRK